MAYCQGLGAATHHWCAQRLCAGRCAVRIVYREGRVLLCTCRRRLRDGAMLQLRRVLLLPRYTLHGTVGAAAALTGALWATPASATSRPETKSSWLPAKPGGGVRQMPPVDPKGRPRVIFQGELGAYGETAIIQHFGADGSIPVPCDDFESVRAHAARLSVRLRA